MNPDSLPQDVGATASSPSWRAIVIGINQYPSLGPSDQLSGCVNDAESIAEFLIQRVGIPATNIALLTSPVVTGATLATAENIRAALRALCEGDAVKAGDHVVLTYACHGVRLSPKGGVPGSPVYYGLAAADLARGSQGFTNLVLDQEFNRFLRTLTRRKVSVTVIADTCHSGASTRDIASPTEVKVRALQDIEPLSEAEWQHLVQTHPALSANQGERGLPKEQTEKETEEEPEREEEPDRDADFVVLCACRDTEKANEASEKVVDSFGKQVSRSHGLLTLSLLHVLRQRSDSQIKSLRWLDLYDDLLRAVQQRLAVMGISSQHPALEGRPERPVFGGKWTPFAPGFTVRTGSGGLTVDGGTLHGLDVGAELDLYPADTADFDAASGRAVRARVVAATLSTCTAELVDPAAAVQDRARGRLAKPSPSEPPMRVRLLNVPAPVVSAATLDDEAATGVITVVAADAPAHVEVRPYQAAVPLEIFAADSQERKSWLGARAGWVLVRSDLVGTPARLPADFTPEREDIIAYLPGEGPLLDRLKDQDLALGRALRDGLLHYSQYLRTRDRSASDETLRACLSVKLRVGQAADAPAMDNASTLRAELLAKTTYLDPDAGIYPVEEGQWLFLELQVVKAPALRLQVGLLACSDDGNVQALWPAPGESYTFDAGKLTYIGVDRFNPLFLNCRPDQQQSRWTLKLIVYTAPADSEPINLQGLAQLESVQDRFAAVLKAGRALIGRPQAQAERPAWCTFDLHIVCKKT